MYEQAFFIIIACLVCYLYIEKNAQFPGANATKKNF